MHASDLTSPAHRRDLVLVATLMVALAAAAGQSGAAAAAVLVPAALVAAGLGTVGRLGDGVVGRLPPLLLAAVLAGGAAAAAHLIPVGLWLPAGLLALAVVLDQVLALETGILAQPSVVSDGDRARVLVAAVVTAFVAFTGAAALVPGGMPEPAGTPVTGSSSMAQGPLAVLAALDALAALVVGWRLAELRFGQPVEIVRSAATYALVTAIAAGLIRAIDLPRLVGPAVLTLVFYLWDAQHGSAPARRRERRFVIEMVLLAILAVVVVAWNTRVPQ